eukprot:Mycagemm_TRINITY_DN9312_c0_g2::TRINITY_DN9312_c0_g2_i1::g.3266::m.3266 type:complete len:140 gc:universal TRINITY_DN9312_c0_g2_i1:1113-694(-)
MQRAEALVVTQVRCSTTLKQYEHQVCMATERGPIQRRVAVLVAGVGVSAVSKKQLRDLDIARGNGVVQRGETTRVLRVDVDSVVNEELDTIETTVPGSLGKRASVNGIVELRCCARHSSGKGCSRGRRPVLVHERTGGV